MTKRNKTRQLFSKLIVEEYWRKYHSELFGGWNESGFYREFLRTQAHKNNVYAMALRQIEG